jgi:hypothetical protein
MAGGVQKRRVGHGRAIGTIREGRASRVKRVVTDEGIDLSGEPQTSRRVDVAAFWSTIP